MTGRTDVILAQSFASKPPNLYSISITLLTVFNYIECDYDRWRRDSAWGGLSPEQFENQTLA